MKRNHALARYGARTNYERQFEAAPLAIVGGHGIRRCNVEGCNNLVMDGERCNRCREELEALERMAIERTCRRHARQERMASLLEMWLVFWDWMKTSPVVTWVLGVFVAASWLYICGRWGVALVEWLKT